MKAISTQLEIIIVTGTSFAGKQLAPKNDGTDNAGGSEKDRLTEACWNGMLPILLPELCDQIPDGKTIYLWEVNQADAFIELELGEKHEPMEKCFSVNPYRFIAEQSLS